MTSTSNGSILVSVAELRAAGTRWPEVATQLNIELDVLRRTVREKQREYDQLVRRARKELQQEAADAMLATLRGLLDSPDPKVKLTAATSLMRYEMARMREQSNRAKYRSKATNYLPAEECKSIENPSLPTSQPATSSRPADQSKPRAANTSESTKSSNGQGVSAAKKSSLPPRVTAALANGPDPVPSWLDAPPG